MRYSTNEGKETNMPVPDKFGDVTVLVVTLQSRSYILVM